MAVELIYTSVPRGLRPGATGYTTVAHTAGLGSTLAARLEGLSGYRHLTVGPDPAASGNPVRYAHTVLADGSHVLSRVADTGLDHSDRSNFLAHHVVLDPGELAAAGPAWVCAHPGVFEAAWHGPPRVLDHPRPLPAGDAPPRLCARWAAATGDAGWGGILAAATDPAAPAYLVFPSGVDVLPLLGEALALLPAAARWGVTFNTYFTGATAGVGCQWRAVPAGSKEARAALADRRGVVIRLDEDAGPAPAGPLVAAARTGAAPADAPTPRPLVGILEPNPPRRSARRRPAAEPVGYELVGYEPVAVTAPAEDLPPDPVPALRPAAAPRGAVGPLLLGLVLGGLALLVAVSLVEVTTDRSVLRHAGLGDDKAAAELKELRAEYERLGADVEKAKKAAAARDAELIAANDELKRLRIGNSGSQEKPPTVVTVPVVVPIPLKEGGNDAGGVVELDKQIKKLKDELNALRKPLVIGVPLPAKAEMLESFELLRLSNKQEFARFDLHGAVGLVATGGGDITGKGKGPFDARLRAGQEGVITLTTADLKPHPLLGLGVIEVRMTDGSSAYRQLFRPKDVVGLGLNPITPKDKKAAVVVHEYTLGVISKLSDPLKQEVGDWLKNGENSRPELGPVARVRVNMTDFDLEYQTNDPNVLVNNPVKDAPGIKMWVHVPETKGAIDLKVEVTYAKPQEKAASAVNVKVMAADIGRTVLLGEGKGKVFQEFFRLRDPN